jgi:hypothetical protein
MNTTNHRGGKRIHGMTRIGGAGTNHTPFYTTWYAMKERCYNKKFKNYRLWGGKGITVCDKWLDFSGFMEDMFSSYNEHLLKYGRKNTTLDRINNDRGYSKDNCRWATRIEQNSNTSRNTFIEYNGQKKTMSAWARLLGLDRTVIYYRVFVAKWPLEKALSSTRY